MRERKGKWREYRERLKVKIEGKEEGGIMDKILTGLEVKKKKKLYESRKIILV